MTTDPYGTYILEHLYKISERKIENITIYLYDMQQYCMNEDPCPSPRGHNKKRRV